MSVRWPTHPHFNYAFSKNVCLFYHYIPIYPSYLTRLDRGTYLTLALHTPPLHVHTPTKVGEVSNQKQTDQKWVRVKIKTGATRTALEQLEETWTSEREYKMENRLEIEIEIRRRQGTLYSGFWSIVSYECHMIGVGLWSVEICYLRNKNPSQ